MLSGPMTGLTARTSVPGDAAVRPAAPIFSVIEAVVFGLTINMRTFFTPSSPPPDYQA